MFADGGRAARIVEPGRERPGDSERSMRHALTLLIATADRAKPVTHAAAAQMRWKDMVNVVECGGSARAQYP